MICVPPSFHGSGIDGMARSIKRFKASISPWMVPPAKGDYASIPMTPAAKMVADAWDPAKDETAGEQCRSYGAAAIMRVPGRLRITWQDDNTLKLETDAGMQTRLLHFGS